METKVKIEQCPKCKSPSFTVTEQDLIDALGTINCENCDTPLHEVMELKPIKKSKPAPITCRGDFLEDDGFCTQCGRNHFGGERPETPSISESQSVVGFGKKPGRVNKQISFHKHVALWSYDW